MNPRPSTVLITGATGSIGRYAVAEALRQGHTVRALVRDQTRAARVLPDGVDLVIADLTRPKTLGPAVDGVYVNPGAGHARTRALRRLQGKTLNALRLIKAAFTFKGGLDYAAWKIRRHSGVNVELTSADRARPLIAGTRLFLLALRRGGLR